jgi:hypothetical protein
MGSLSILKETRRKRKTRIRRKRPILVIIMKKYSQEDGRDTFFIALVTHAG